MWPYARCSRSSSSRGSASGASGASGKSADTRVLLGGLLGELEQLDHHQVDVLRGRLWPGDSRGDLASGRGVDRRCLAPLDPAEMPTGHSLAVEAGLASRDRQRSEREAAQPTLVADRICSRNEVFVYHRLVPVVLVGCNTAPKPPRCVYTDTPMTQDIYKVDARRLHLVFPPVNMPPSYHHVAPEEEQDHRCHDQRSPGTSNAPSWTECAHRWRGWETAKAASRPRWVSSGRRSGNGRTAKRGSLWRPFRRWRDSSICRRMSC